MKKVLVVCVLTVCVNLFANAQITKSDAVYRKGRVDLNCSKMYDGDELTKTSFSLLAQDSKYRQIISMLMVRHDNNANEMYLFLKGINDFLEKYKNDDNVTMDVCGNSVSRYKIGSSKGLLIQDYQKKGLVDFSDKEVGNLLDTFKKYCEKEKINFE
ncbi:MAG: hypothetical protein FWD60_13225 [Candidatus Azobacteroides sp.]|nr:hypothetical protein [Candidatus Azobacteroides sp.]